MSVLRRNYSFFETSSEGYVPDEPVNHRGDHVHHQDGIADAFGVAATQTDQGGQDTQANGIDDLAFFGIGLVTQSVAMKKAPIMRPPANR